MTESEEILHKKLVKDQLTLNSLYWADFERKMGKKVLNQLVDSILDKKIPLDKTYPHLKP